MTLKSVNFSPENSQERFKLFFIKQAKLKKLQTIYKGSSLYSCDIIVSVINKNILGYIWLYMQLVIFKVVMKV